MDTFLYNKFNNLTTNEINCYSSIDTDIYETCEGTSYEDVGYFNKKTGYHLTSRNNFDDDVIDIVNEQKEKIENKEKEINELKNKINILNKILDNYNNQNIKENINLLCENLNIYNEIKNKIILYEKNIKAKIDIELLKYIINDLIFDIEYDLINNLNNYDNKEDIIKDLEYDNDIINNIKNNKYYTKDDYYNKDIIKKYINKIKKYLDIDEYIIKEKNNLEKENFKDYNEIIKIIDKYKNDINNINIDKKELIKINNDLKIILEKTNIYNYYEILEKNSKYNDYEHIQDLYEEARQIIKNDNDNDDDENYEEDYDD